MNRAAALALFAVTLIGCANQPALPKNYKAVGTEPFWSLAIEKGRMTLDRAGLPARTVAAPAARVSTNGYRYETAELTVDITRQPCSDGMSDRRFPDRVVVTVDGKTLHGCGGLLIAAGNVVPR